MASNITSGLHVITNSNIVNKPNLDVSSSSTTASAAILTVATGSFPVLLLSLQLLGDSTFVSDYSYKVTLAGLNIPDNFQLLPSAATGVEIVPTGTAYLIPANSTLKVYAYNSGGASTDGHLSVYAVWDIQSQLSGPGQSGMSGQARGVS